MENILKSSINYKCSNNHIVPLNTIYFCINCNRVLCQHPLCTICDISMLKCVKCNAIRAPLQEKLYFLKNIFL